MKRLIQVTLTAFLVLGIYSISFAQTNSPQSATIQSEASVLADMTIAGPDNLDFGNVSTSTSTNVSVSPGDAESGRFTLSATANSNVNLEFTVLSTTLNQENGSNTLTVSYGGSDAAWDDDQGSTNPGETFDPNSPKDINMPSDGDIGVWIGGTLQLDGTQTAGGYSGDIQLTATYN